MKALITGGAGFIGSHLAQALLERGDEVRVIDDLSTGKRENLEHLCAQDLLELRVKDILRIDESDLTDIDAVYHMAAIPRVQYSIENPAETHRVHVDGTLHLLELLKGSGKRFVFSSSCSVYGDQQATRLDESLLPNPLSPYAMHKLMGEQLCSLYAKLYDVKAVSLRYFNVYGPRASAEGGYAGLIPKFTKMFIEGGQAVINGDGEQTRDFVHVEDVVRANLLAAKVCAGKGEVYNIGTGTPTSVSEVARVLEEVLQPALPAVHGPSLVEPRHATSDSGKAAKELGWTPVYSFEEGLRKTLAYHK